MQQASSSHTDRCRLCGGDTEYIFTKMILEDIECRYLRCAACGSLQTERPHWLDRAYSSSLSRLDTGAANRCVQNQARVYAISKVLGAGTVLDYGGGDGLLTRLLRDLGIDCRVYDRYAKPLYARSFVDEPDLTYDLVCAFEVAEHLPDPASDLAPLFRRGRHVLLSTVLYQGQDKDWWYLSPGSGQHVFFYSERGMARLAGQYGFAKPEFLGEYILFPRAPLTARERLMLRLLFARGFKTLVRIWTTLLPKKGVIRDYEQLTGFAPQQTGQLWTRATSGRAMTTKA